MWKNYYMSKGDKLLDITEKRKRVQILRWGPPSVHILSLLFSSHLSQLFTAAISL